MARRLGLVLVLTLAAGFLLYVAPIDLTSASGLENVKRVSSVKAENLPGPPSPEPPRPESHDVDQIWAAAIARDRSPNLASRGKLGTSGGRISLTFDDGPKPRTTPAILDTLREHDVKATFFVVGRQVEENPDLLRRIVEEGHTIGNHTYDHADMSRLSPGQMRSELQRTQEAVDKALGHHYPMVLMRPPYGAPYFAGSGALPTFKRVVREQQLIPVVWTIDSQDYLMAGDPQGIIRNIIRKDGAGRDEDRDEVILMHDVHPQDAQALPGVLEHYEGSGRSFVNATVLLDDKYPEP